MHCVCDSKLLASMVFALLCFVVKISMGFIVQLCRTISLMSVGNIGFLVDFKDLCPFACDSRDVLNFQKFSWLILLSVCMLSYRLSRWMWNGSAVHSPTCYTFIHTIFIQYSALTVYTFMYCINIAARYTLWLYGYVCTALVHINGYYAHK